MYTGIQDYIHYVHYKTRLYALCTLENKIICSMYSKKQDTNSLCTLEYKIIYSKYTRIQGYILYAQ